MEFSLAKILSSRSSCSRLVWCMHKTIKIIVEATSGDRLAAFYPRLGSWWLAERKAGGSKRDTKRGKERRQQLSNYIENNSLKCSRRSVLACPPFPSCFSRPRGWPSLPNTSDDAQLWLAKSITREKVAGNTRRIEWILQTFPSLVPSIRRLRNERVR